MIKISLKVWLNELHKNWLSVKLSIVVFASDNLASIF